MTPYLDAHLGRCMSAGEVAGFLRCDVSTVYRMYAELGGIKLGASYKFFERSLTDALLRQTVIYFENGILNNDFMA